MEGYLIALLELSCDESLEMEIRITAAISFKNYVIKRVRSTEFPRISSDEMGKIKGTLPSSFVNAPSAIWYVDLQHWNEDSPSK